MGRSRRKVGVTKINIGLVFRGMAYIELRIGWFQFSACCIVLSKLVVRRKQYDYKLLCGICWYEWLSVAVSNRKWQTNDREVQCM